MPNTIWQVHFFPYKSAILDFNMASLVYLKLILNLLFLRPAGAFYVYSWSQYKAAQQCDMSPYFHANDGLEDWWRS